MLETAAVVAGGVFFALLHQAAFGQQPVHGRLGEHDLVADDVGVLLAHELEQRRNAQCVVVIFELAQQVDDRLRDGARAALI